MKFVFYLKTRDSTSPISIQEITVTDHNRVHIAPLQFPEESLRIHAGCHNDGIRRKIKDNFRFVLLEP
jgi:hypothetical protein